MIRKSPTCVLNMPMNEGQGDPHDSSGFGNNGTINGGVTWTNGTYGRALNFDGSTGYVNCGSNSSLNPDEIATAAWVKIDSSTFHNIVSKSASYLYFPRINSDGKLLVRLYFSDATETGELTDAACTISDNNWHYIVCSFSSTSGNLCVYIDGQSCKTYSGYTGKIVRESGSIVYIGSRYGTTNFLDGTISDVRIYNRDLSSTEILDYFNATKARYGL